MGSEIVPFIMYRLDFLASVMNVNSTMNGAKMRLFYTGVIVNVVTIISMPARFKTDTRKIIYAALNKVMDRPRLAPTRTSNQTFLHRDISQTHEDYQYINNDKMLMNTVMSMSMN